jgi:septum formation protein
MVVLMDGVVAARAWGASRNPYSSGTAPCERGDCGISLVPVLHLASQSPQRASLLMRARIVFSVVESHCDEESIHHAHPQMLALERARGKARGARLTSEQLRALPAVALGADTVVALGMTVFGKPSDRSDAERILSCLQGTTHSVLTGHCCIRFAPDGTVVSEASAIALAKVTMRPLSLDEIRAYVASGESDGRAGAYAIQERGDRFVTDLQGSWDTVVGLNVAMAARLHQECTDAWPEGYQP